MDILSFTTLHLGIDKEEKKYGFYGNLKMFALFSEYIDDYSVIQKISHTSIYEEPALLFSFLLFTNDHFLNEVDKTRAILVGEKPTLPEIFDFEGIQFCSS